MRRVAHRHTSPSPTSASPLSDVWFAVEDTLLTQSNVIEFDLYCMSVMRFYGLDVTGLDACPYDCIKIEERELRK